MASARSATPPVAILCDCPVRFRFMYLLHCNSLRRKIFVARCMEVYWELQIKCYVAADFEVLRMVVMGSLLLSRGSMAVSNVLYRIGSECGLLKTLGSSA
jgi:hypothetical protein